MPTTFSELMRQAQAVAESGRFTLSVSEDWLQGRSLFGGLQAALALAAMRSLVPGQPLRSLQTNFIAPLAGALRAEASVLRAGNNTTQLEARLYSEQGLATQCMAVFGKPLESHVSVVVPPREPLSGESIVFPFLPGLTPNFTQHFGMRLFKGHPPFSGVPMRDAVYQLDLKDKGRAGESQLLAIADVVPPIGLTFLEAPAFGSTLSWFLEIVSDPGDALDLAGWQLDVQLVAARDGYTNQSTTVYAPNGQAMALSRQSMLIFG